MLLLLSKSRKQRNGQGRSRTATKIISKPVRVQISLLHQAVKDLCHGLHTQALDSWSKPICTLGPKPPNESDSAATVRRSRWMNETAVHARAAHHRKKVPNIRCHGMRELKQVAVRQVLLRSEHVACSPSGILTAAECAVKHLSTKWEAMSALLSCRASNKCRTARPMRHLRRHCLHARTQRWGIRPQEKFARHRQQVHVATGPCISCREAAATWDLPLRRDGPRRQAAPGHRLSGERPPPACNEVLSTFEVAGAGILIATSYLHVKVPRL